MEVPKGLGSKDALNRASRINLERHPDSPAALALAEAVMRGIIEHRVGKRTIGPKGMPGFLADLGSVLAGVMRPGLNDTPVRVQASSAGEMWTRSSIGRDKCWGILENLERSGFVGKQPGIRFNPLEAVGGKAAAFWPTSALLHLASSHGCTAETRQVDWRVDAKRMASKLPSHVKLITCKPAPTPQPLAEATKARMDGIGASMKARLERINRVIENADIKGAGHCASLVRRFRHCFDLSGRFYGSHVNLSQGERSRITIGGEAVVEVDLKASQMAVLLGLMGWRDLPDDPYDFPGLDRKIVKRFMVQTFGTGRAAGRWSLKGGQTAPEMSCKAVWGVVRERYPFLKDLSTILPDELRMSLHPDDLGWAAGQYLVAREAEVIESTLMDFAICGVAALPVHDSLVVVAAEATSVERSFKTNFKRLLGVIPKVEAKG